MNLTASHFRKSVLLAARETAVFARAPTSRSADISKPAPGRARWPGSLLVRTSLVVLPFYKSQSTRPGEKRRCTAPRAQPEIQGDLLRTFRRFQLPCRGTWKSLASLRKAYCR